MSDRSEIHSMLRHWGKWFGPAPAAEWDEDESEEGSLTASVFAQIRVGMAPMGQEPVMGERPVKVRGGGGVIWKSQRLTAKGKQSKGGPGTWHPNLDAERVEVAALELYRHNRAQAVVLRMEYCMGRFWNRKEKVRFASRHLDTKLTRYTYGLELDAAREWMAERLGMRRAA